MPVHFSTWRSHRRDVPLTGRRARLRADAALSARATLIGAKRPVQRLGLLGRRRAEMRFQLMAAYDESLEHFRALTAFQLAQHQLPIQRFGNWIYG